MKLITIPQDIKAANVSPPLRGPVMAALEKASAQTGADFGYLLKTATRESSLNPTAKAATSSATGLFQFIEQTWLATVKKHGEAHGLGAYAKTIEQGSDGRYKVAGPANAQAILALRKDPETAAVMAGAMTVDMVGALQQGLGRTVSSGEVYAAHVMGTGGALKLIRAAESQPNVTGAELFPAAANANKSIFYDKDGTARSASAVLAKLTSKHDNATMTVVASQSVSSAPPVSTASQQPLRGSYFEADIPTPGRDWVQGIAEAYILSPVMVQILSSLDEATNGDRDGDEAGRLRSSL